jgi:hypothetical protein
MLTEVVRIQLEQIAESRRAVDSDRLENDGCFGAFH